MKAVSILRDQREHAPGVFEGSDRPVPGVGGKVLPKLPQTLAPCLHPDRPGGDVVADVGELSGIRVPGSHALRAAEIRTPRVGGDAGSGEEDHLAGAPQRFTAQFKIRC